VGSGKTALVAALCRLLAGRFETAVITNDIYTKEDAEALLRLGVMPPERVVAVETGCCPHTAIRDDVAGGDKVPRKGGPGISRSDLLVINKIDLAPMVGADLRVMARDAAAQRGERPTLFTSLVSEDGARPVAAFIEGNL